MPHVELSAGSLDYEDTGGGGPVIVFVHGLMMDGSVWRQVVAELRGDYRCVLPTLPLGAHRRPMHADADLSMRGIAGLLGEFLERLDLRDLTLAVNDWGGPILLLSERRAERIRRVVLTSCEAFDNVPPGLPGTMAVLAAKLPGALHALVQSLRLRPPRRLPFAFGWMSKRPVPQAVMDAWLQPAIAQSAIRRDLGKYLKAAGQGRRDLIAATDALRAFDRPTLVVWATEDRIMPPEHGRRLAQLLPQGRLIEIADSYTLIPEDQPAELATAMRSFIATS